MSYKGEGLCLWLMYKRYDVFMIMLNLHNDVNDNTYFS